ncbi:TGO1-like protein [Mya arenaria]|uniref:TGO1-like protein n=1 Tax=Mya arenaria TaxID=6604 RepID=A0ABY7FJQ7_MYAAR|nr:TGO1-like protein [Mya arenaria]
MLRRYQTYDYAQTDTVKPHVPIEDRIMGRTASHESKPTRQPPPNQEPSAGDQPPSGREPETVPVVKQAMDAIETETRGTEAAKETGQDVQQAQADQRNTNTQDVREEAQGDETERDETEVDETEINEETDISEEEKSNDKKNDDIDQNVPADNTEVDETEIEDETDISEDETEMDEVEQEPEDQKPHDMREEHKPVPTPNDKVPDEDSTEVDDTDLDSSTTKEKLSENPDEKSEGMPEIKADTIVNEDDSTEVDGADLENDRTEVEGNAEETQKNIESAEKNAEGVEAEDGIAKETNGEKTTEKPPAEDGATVQEKKHDGGDKAEGDTVGVKSDETEVPGKEEEGGSILGSMFGAGKVEDVTNNAETIQDEENDVNEPNVNMVVSHDSDVVKSETKIEQSDSNAGSQHSEQLNEVGNEDKQKERASFEQKDRTMQSAPDNDEHEYHIGDTDTFEAKELLDKQQVIENIPQVDAREVNLSDEKEDEDTRMHRDHTREGNIDISSMLYSHVDSTLSVTDQNAAMGNIKGMDKHVEPVEVNTESSTETKSLNLHDMIRPTPVLDINSESTNTHPLDETNMDLLAAIAPNTATDLSIVDETNAGPDSVYKSQVSSELKKQSVSSETFIPGTTEFSSIQPTKPFPNTDQTLSYTTMKTVMDTEPLVGLTNKNVASKLENTDDTDFNEFELAAKAQHSSSHLHNHNNLLHDLLAAKMEEEEFEMAEGWAASMEKGESRSLYDNNEDSEIEDSLYDEIIDGTDSTNRSKENVQKSEEHVDKPNSEKDQKTTNEDKVADPLDTAARESVLARARAFFGSKPAEVEKEEKTEDIQQAEPEKVKEISGTENIDQEPVDVTSKREDGRNEQTPEELDKKEDIIDEGILGKFEKAFEAMSEEKEKAKSDKEKAETDQVLKKFEKAFEAMAKDKTDPSDDDESLKFVNEQGEIDDEQIHKRGETVEEMEIKEPVQKEVVSELPNENDESIADILSDTVIETGSLETQTENTDSTMIDATSSSEFIETQEVEIHSETISSEQTEGILDTTSTPAVESQSTVTDSLTATGTFKDVPTKTADTLYPTQTLSETAQTLGTSFEFHSMASEGEQTVPIETGKVIMETELQQNNETVDSHIVQDQVQPSLDQDAYKTDLYLSRKPLSTGVTESTETTTDSVNQNTDQNNNDPNQKNMMENVMDYFKESTTQPMPDYEIAPPTDTPPTDDPYSSEHMLSRKVPDPALEEEDENKPGVDVVKTLEQTLKALIDILPGSMQSMLEEEPLGLSPPLTLLVSMLSTCVLGVLTCVGCLCTGGKTRLEKKDPLVVIRSLEEKLFIATKEKENLEDEVQLKEQKQQVSMLHQEITDNKHMISELEQECAQKSGEVEAYATDVEHLEHRANEADLALKKAFTSLSEKGEELMKATQLVESLTEQVRRLETRKQQLEDESTDWSEKVKELSEQVEQSSVETRRMQEDLAFKENELEVLRDCFLQMMDVSRVNASLRAVEEERDVLNNKLAIEIESRQEMEDQMQSLKRKLEGGQTDKMKAERQCQEAQTKLEVLSKYFREKETELTRQLGEQEVLKNQNISKLQSSDSFTQELSQEKELYRQQVDDLKTEITKAERDFRSQLATRAAERELKESRHECGMLRQKLTDLERKLMQGPPPGLIRPITHRPMPPPGMLNGPRPPPPGERPGSRGDDDYRASPVGGYPPPPPDRRLPPGARPLPPHATSPPPFAIRPPYPGDRRSPPPFDHRVSPKYNRAPPPHDGRDRQHRHQSHV